MSGLSLHPSYYARRAFLSKQQFLYTKSAKEAAVFEEDYSEVLELRQKLKLLLNCSKAWFKASSQMAKNALEIAKTLNQDFNQEDKDKLLQLQKELRSQSKTGTLTKSLRKRISLLDQIRDQRKSLVILRLKSERSSRKKLHYQTAVESEKNAKKLEYWTKRATQDHDDYNDLLVQLAGALRAVREHNNGENNEKSASRDLAAIRTSLRYLFRTCVEVFSDGTGDVGSFDGAQQAKSTNSPPLSRVSDAMEAAEKAEDEGWKRFSSRVSDAMDKAATVEGVPQDKRLSNRLESLKKESVEQENQTSSEVGVAVRTPTASFDDEADSDDESLVSSRDGRVSSVSDLGIDLDVVPGEHTGALANALQNAQRKMRESG